MGLKEYKRKRDFSTTPEPVAGGVRGRKLFVVQLHHASHRHYDFRLEFDGVLKSWAIPKGPSFDPSVKRLAVEVEDHPLSYAGFEGDIPKDNYGAGHVDIFDSGSWEALGNAREGLERGELKFVLKGDVLRGSWVLVRTRRRGSKQQWLLIKHRDEFAGERDVDAFVDPQTDRPIGLAKRKQVWKAAHRRNAKNPLATERSKPISLSPTGARSETIDSNAFEPELCKSMPHPPSGDDWLHEVKWDGYRILATVVGKQVRLWSRNAIEWTDKVPELAAAITSLKLGRAQFDGEMIVLKDGRDDFNSLQGRLSAESRDPLVYMLFDMPHLNGKSLRDVPLLERKKMLKVLLEKHVGGVLRYSEHQIGHGKDVFAQATSAGLEGVISKRVDSLYRGGRTGDWIKSKRRPSDEFIVVGFTQRKGSASDLGALLLAQPRNGQLTYVGRVGTGIDREQRRALRKQLMPTAVKKPPANIERMDRKARALAIWVKPRLVVEVFHQGVGGQGLLRQPAFKALRADKSATNFAGDPGAAQNTQRTSYMKKERVRTAANPAPRPVTITHPDREVFPDLGITKQDVATYYRTVAPWILAEIAGRPLSVVRCPDGADNACFFQKHMGTGWGDHVYGVAIEEKAKREKYLCIDDEVGLLELVQLNALEFHPWGASASDPDHADRIVFDLDPHATVRWSRVIAAARELRKHLASINLGSFVRTSGGKGLHVVVPLNPQARWDAAKQFARAVAEAMASLHPKEFASVAGEKNREDRIFVDWLRNARGATSIASYSLRARSGAGVAMPLRWEELGRIKGGDTFTITSALNRIRRRKVDPWAKIRSIKQSLPRL